MTESQFNELTGWFYTYTRNLTPENKKHTDLIDLKIDHSERVAEIARQLAEEMQWPRSDIRTGEVLGLLHDIGRFSQIIEHSTFSDPDSIDHGERGYQVLRENGALSGLDVPEQNAILFGVRHHNDRDFPTDIPAESTRFVKLVRDSDKLDIFRVIDNIIRERKFDEHPEMTLNIDIDGPPTAGAIAEIKKRETISYQNVLTLADFALTELSWTYDLQYPGALRRMVEWGCLDRIISLLPDTDEMREIITEIRSYIGGQFDVPRTEKNIQ